LTQAVFEQLATALNLSIRIKYSTITDDNVFVDTFCLTAPGISTLNYLHICLLFSAGARKKCGSSGKSISH